MENDLEKGNRGAPEQPQGTVANLRLGSYLYARYASFPTPSPVGAGIANRLAHFGSDSRLPLAQRILQRWSSRGLSRGKLPGLEWLNDFRSDPRTRVALASARPVAKLSRFEATSSPASANVVQLSAADAPESGAADLGLRVEQTTQHVQTEHSDAPESLSLGHHAFDPESVAHGSVSGTPTSHIKRPAPIPAPVAARVANTPLAGDVFTEGFKERPVSKRGAWAVARIHADDQNARDVRRVHSRIVETTQRHVSGVSSTDDGSKLQRNAVSTPWSHADRSDAIQAQETLSQPFVATQGEGEASPILGAKRVAVRAASDKTIAQTEREIHSSAQALENPRIAQRYSESAIMGPPIFRRTVNGSSKTTLPERTSTPPGSISDSPIGRATTTTQYPSVEAKTSPSPLVGTLGQIVARVPESASAPVGGSKTSEVSISHSIASRVDAAGEETSPERDKSKSAVVPDGASHPSHSEIPKISAESPGGKVTGLDRVHASLNSAAQASAVNNVPLAYPLEGIVYREQTLYKADGESPLMDQRADSLAKRSQTLKHPPAARIERKADNATSGSGAAPTAELAHLVSAAPNSKATVDGPTVHGLTRDIAARAVPLIHGALPSNLSRSGGTVHKNEASTSRRENAAPAKSPIAAARTENSGAVVAFTRATNQSLAENSSTVFMEPALSGQRVHKEISRERINPESIRATEKNEVPFLDSHTVSALTSAESGTGSPVFRAAIVGEQPSHTANVTHVDPRSSSQKPLGDPAIASANWFANTSAEQELSKDATAIVSPARLDPMTSPAGEHRISLSSSISTGVEWQNAPVERGKALSKVRPPGDSKSRATSTHGEWMLASRAQNIQANGHSAAGRIEAPAERLLATPSSMPQLNGETLVLGVQRSLGFSPAESTHRSTVRVLEREAAPVRGPALTHRLAPSAERLQMAVEPNPAGAFSSMNGTSMRATKMSATNSRSMLMPAVASAAPTPPPTLPTITNQLGGNVRGSGKVEINQLANRVYDMLVRRLASERQRRGQ